MRAWVRRLLGRDQVDRLDAALLESHHANLAVNHVASLVHHELQHLRSDLQDVTHRIHHLEDVALADLARRLEHAETTLVAAVRQAAWIDPGDPPADGPLVSVIMPTWQRATEIGAALRSLRHQTYHRWECFVIDDGSDDGTDVVVATFLDDQRISYERIEHRGAPTARNRGLDMARGDIVAYLDTDNTWHPTHLARVVRALAEHKEADWTLSGQLVVDEDAGRATVRNDLRTLGSLASANHCDLNAIAHRRGLLADIGVFDPALLRLSDWDLVLRLAARTAPARIDAVTSTYRSSGGSRITDLLPAHHFAHQIRARHRGLPASGLRLLFAEWHYPQVTETYIDALVSGLRRLGADVQVWSETDVAVPYPSPVPVHRDGLDAAIDATQPHLVVTNWVNMGATYLPVTQARGLPHVVRTHGFEFDPAVVQKLLDGGALVHTYPHLVDPSWADHPRLEVTVTCFDDQRYGPAATKDRQLVLRTSAGLLTKDLDTFLLAADLCPDHRFVLVIAHAMLVEERTEAVVARRDELGSRAEILVDLQHDEVAALVSDAGIYLHTHGTDHAVSMPISIAEAMATGSWVLGRDLPGIADYVGRAGTVYGGDTVEDRASAAALLIRGSREWPDDVWAARQVASVDQAFEHHASVDVAEQMLRAWRRAFALPVSRPTPPSGAR